MQQKQLGLATEKIGRLMGRYAVPCVISLLVGGALQYCRSDVCGKWQRKKRGHTMMVSASARYDR